jgi:hypothetical protein
MLFKENSMISLVLAIEPPEILEQARLRRVTDYQIKRQSKGVLDRANLNQGQEEVE